MATRKTLKELDQELDQLAGSLQAHLADVDEHHQSDAFAGVADGILEATPPEHHDHVWSRLHCIQREAGLIPGDDEPCSDE